MKLIVGLGNIGNQYDNTRHNIGFEVIDNLLSFLKIKLDKEGFNGQYTKTKLNDVDVLIIKPTTFMNLSGICVQEIMKFYKVSPNDLIVIHDDLDQDVGKYKVKTTGGSGGHNGIKSIIQQIGTENFVRFKLGIGKPKKEEVINYVLSKFNKQDKELMTVSKMAALKFVISATQMPIQEAIAKINNGNLENK